MFRMFSNFRCQVFVFLLLISSVDTLMAQDECDGYRYRYTGAFDGFEVEYDVPYGENFNVNFLPEELVMDVYSPTGDVEESRPLILIAHGGFFLSGSNGGLEVVPLCEDLAQMGYVVASINYRKGVSILGNLTNEFIKAVWRGVHDSRAAVRYFRHSLDYGNPWDIDANRIYLGGISAGAFIALHHAYVDEQSEIPAEIDVTQVGLGGGLEGLSGNTGYSSEVNGVFNIAGALQTTDFMNLGVNEPLFSIHGTEDQTVPYGEGGISLLGIINLIDVDGSSIVHNKAEEIGLDHCLITVEGAGHVPHIDIFNPGYYDLTLSALAGKLGEWACEDYVPICGDYDYEAESLLEDMRIDENPLVFPNPARTQGRVFVTFKQSTSWKLVNVMGQTMKRGRNSAGSRVVWQSLAPGLYIIQSETGSTQLVVSD